MLVPVLLFCTLCPHLDGEEKAGLLYFDCLPDVL